MGIPINSLKGTVPLFQVMTTSLVEDPRRSSRKSKTYHIHHCDLVARNCHIQPLHPLQRDIPPGIHFPDANALQTEVSWTNCSQCPNNFSPSISHPAIHPKECSAYSYCFYCSHFFGSGFCRQNIGLKVIYERCVSNSEKINVNMTDSRTRTFLRVS